jgi:UDP-N-acetylglucosamine 3-dehydrogenase
MKVGVVGLGSIGSRHMRNLKMLGHEVPVYDPVLPQRVAFERSIYEDCEAVVVASPTMFHEQALRACVERNRHVLIEKPISKQIGAIPDLLRRADDKGLVVMTGNNLRLHPCVQQVKQWLGAGEIGEPLWASFTCAHQTEKYTDDGVVLNTGAHEVDLALYLFGPAKCLTAHESDTAAYFTLLHDSGVRSNFFLDHATPHRIREFWIAGAEKNIGVDLDNRRMSLGTEATQAPGSYDDDYRNEMSAFIDRINGRFAPGATGHDGLATLRTLLDVRKKAALS